MTKSPITTHVLDNERGRPASLVPIKLDYKDSDSWKQVAEGVTDEDGRIMNWPGENFYLREGLYRVTFDTGKYFSGQERETFYPEVSIAFRVDKKNEHYHVPLLLSGFGYSTYRGS